MVAILYPPNFPRTPTWTLPTLPATFPTLPKKEVEKKAEKTVKPKLPKQASATAQAAVLKF